MNKLIIPIIAVIILVMGIGGYFVLQQFNLISLSPQAITTFEECVKADYPVLLTYPRQCKTPDGRFFKEERPGSDKFVSYPQKFHVEGNKIDDEAGNEVVFRGVNIAGVIAHSYYTKFGDKSNEKYLPWDENYFKQISNLGTKIIRLNILPGEFRESPEDFSFKAIDQSIDWASQYQMYVYITYHGIGFPPTEYYGEGVWKIEEKYTATREEMLDYWDKISKRYKDNKVVAFYEIYNEPTHSGSSGKPTQVELEKDWLEWKKFSEEVIDVIRKNDPDAVILVGGLNLAYDVSFALKNPIERGGIIYATHPYPCKSEEHNKSWDEAFGNVKEKYPVFATEFSVNGLEDGPIKCESVQNELRKLVYLEDLIEEAKSYPGDKQKEHELFLKATERIKNNKTAFDYLINVREKYKKEIEEYLEDRKISWTGFIFYSIYPEFSMVDGNYNLTEVGEWFKKWMREKRIK